MRLAAAALSASRSDGVILQHISCILLDNTTYMMYILECNDY